MTQEENIEKMEAIFATRKNLGEMLRKIEVAKGAPNIEVAIRAKNSAFLYNISGKTIDLPEQ